jgi:hypothetical protein
MKFLFCLIDDLSRTDLWNLRASGKRHSDNSLTEWSAAASVIFRRRPVYAATWNHGSQTLVRLGPRSARHGNNRLSRAASRLASAGRLNANKRQFCVSWTRRNIPLPEALAETPVRINGSIPSMNSRILAQFGGQTRVLNGSTLSQVRQRLLMSFIPSACERLLQQSTIPPSNLRGPGGPSLCFSNIRVPEKRERPQRV